MSDGILNEKRIVDLNSGVLAETPPPVTVIVLNYNNLNDTLRTLRSVLAMTYQNFRVILVENSTEAWITGEIRAALPHLEIHENMENLGYAGGNNAGIRHALKDDPEYLLILNNDLIVESDLLNKITKEMALYPDAAACQPLVLYEENRDLIWSAGTIYQFGYPRLYLKNSASFPIETFRPPFGLVGCALLLRVDALQTIGLFDESLFLMHEETDWCIRAAGLGYDLLVVPSARVWHAVSATLGPLSEPYLYYVSRNWLLVAKKDFSPLGFIYVLLTECLIRFPFYCFKLVSRRNPGMIRHYLAGLIDGIRGVSGEMKRW